MSISIRKSSPWIAVVYIIAIIMIGFAFSVLMKPAKVVYDASYVNENVQDDIYQNFYTRSRTVFVWLPLIVAIPVLLWILIKSHEKDQGY